ncbi:MAG: hypothetical protein HRU14_04765 [Planctomycetes bacterium]|nr:hypothetical protein [Planctomycetota bacterium]
MQRLVHLVLLAVLLAGLPAQEPPADLCGRYVHEDGLRVLYLWGTPEQRGFAQGWLLGDVIVRNFDADLTKLMARGRKEQYEERLLKSVVPRFAFNEDEEAELAGMLRGIEARLPEEKRQVKFLDRAVTLADLKAANTVGDWMALGCSTFAIDGTYTKDGAPAVARNFDFPAFRMVLDDQHIVVHAPDGKSHGWIGVSYPGSIATMTGLNADGVFISIHDVFIFPGLLTAFRPNVPRLCALRRVMRDVSASDTLAGVHDRLKSWRTMYGNNFMVVTPGAKAGEPFAGVFEYDSRYKAAGGVHLRLTDHLDSGTRPFLLCTNHHRVRKPRKDDPEKLCRRYNGLRDAVMGIDTSDGATVTPERMFEVLSVAAFPKDNRPLVRYRHGTTHQAVAFTGAKELWVRLGVVGKNIREITPRCVKVSEALAAAKAGAAKTSPSKR